MQFSSAFTDIDLHEACGLCCREGGYVRDNNALERDGGQGSVDSVFQLTTVDWGSYSFVDTHWDMYEMWFRSVSFEGGTRFTNAHVM